MADMDDVELLASLLEESRSAAENCLGGCGEPAEEAVELDEFDELFDADEEGSYTDEIPVSEEEKGVKDDVALLFGDVEDLEEEEEEGDTVTHSNHSNMKQSPDLSQEKTQQDLEAELQRMQGQMRKLQEQLQQTVLGHPASTPQPNVLPPTKSKGPAVSRSPLRDRTSRTLQESPCFAAQLTSSVLQNQKQEVKKTPLPASGSKSPSQRSVAALLANGFPARAGAGSGGNSAVFSVKHQQIPVEKFSGLRLRKPRVSSVEMEKKMSGRKLIRLSQLRDRLATEKLEDTDWVTFGVIVKKITPQSSNSGKTFSIWYLNDLRNLDRCVSLFLFGDVHKEHWKTEQGTVLGLLNATPMKPKDGSQEVCLSIDHPQKILIMGEALDMGNCKARKKNGDPCTQIVNLGDCEYCQFHVRAQYKKLSAKRADLQSSYSSRAPKRNSLKARLCQEGFHYGGVSSMAYAASLGAAAPKKAVQTTLTNLVVRGAEAAALLTKQKIAAGSRRDLQCSEEFKGLMELPTPGALNLKKHLTKSTAPGAVGKSGPAFQSISASVLLKQQKQQMLDARRKRTEEIQRRFLQSQENVEFTGLSALGQPVPQSPRPGAEFPKGQEVSAPQTPKLGRGFSNDEDVLFYDSSLPPALKLSNSEEAKKLLAVDKLRLKGQILAKMDPNSIKRKRASPFDTLKVGQIVEKNILAPQVQDEQTPVVKKRREQLAYLQSVEFQELLNAKSKHVDVLKEAEAEMHERYFEPLVIKEQMEEKMRNIREQKCRAVTCKTCNYTHFKPLETCVSENHDFHWHDAVKRFFKCPCGNRTISLDRLPRKHCSTCGLYKWHRDGMLKERTGPKIGGETLLPRGEEHSKFLNSLK
ncbi:protein MCM10 homolog isoform X2 [Microcaecilia unicolor]|uniref:Protein MCM10 homolog n=1 Tax=Microcaecilia unicolor TaxID=1415580 RepID=A0A6P7Z923_9AMPH|nr:protein MCM10 homolog isoform X2 [Microcaecilia unicolor]